MSTKPLGAKVYYALVSWCSAFVQGCTPLHTAAATEKAESVRLLLTYGADVGAVDKQVSLGRMMGTCAAFILSSVMAH